MILSVEAELGRMVAVHPDLQIVLEMLVGVTAEMMAPGLTEATGITIVSAVALDPAPVIRRAKQNNEIWPNCFDDLDLAIRIS
jgi:hypothetical protein